ncbi:GATA zinc finger domain-containing protein 1-like [Gigantopelta aegis]|uniref:GATA zinc finger domain-containing protein 1-like n=1 Tax=Gigantopelta aegis TaxID=1735272 RepID=UPI001B889271|nr:GATA zinc finger domain-containing protein 1-like [Gigantopelta aegis]
MPLGYKPICASCKTTTSAIWRKGEKETVLCNSCVVKGKTNGNGAKDGNGAEGDGVNLQGAKSANGNNGNGGSNMAGPILRKSSRIRPRKSRFQAATKTLATKGKSRRIIFKKSQPVKAPIAVSTIVTGESIFHDGMYYQVGDVVSLVDHDGSVYYAQLRGFMQDQYSEKSAVITWLLPTQGSPRHRFDPSTYILGPEEDLPRKLDFMEFVCHAPSDYFRAYHAPYHTVTSDHSLCYVWTSMGSQVQPVPAFDEMFHIQPVPRAGGKVAKEKTAKDKHKEREKTDLAKVIKTEKEVS